MTASYIRRLTAAFPSIDEIWLIGSRASGAETAASDWDYIVFGPAQLLDALRLRVDLHDPAVDVLVVNGDRLQHPWAKKSGSLTRWCWRRTSDTAATYHSVKGRGGDGDFYMEIRTARATLIWRRAGPEPSTAALR